MVQRRELLALGVSALLAGCAGLALREPLRVQLVGLEPLPGEGMELRFLCKLRVQNPNDRGIDFRGVSLELRLQGNAVATGETDTPGTLPAFGEAVVLLPLTLSVESVARTILDLILSEGTPRLDYALRGKLGTTFGSVPFESRGVVDLGRGERT